MRRFKSIAAVMLLCTVFLYSTGLIRADLIFEPQKNGFFWEHREELEYDNHTYEVRGPGEGMPVYRSPVDADRVGEVKTGARVGGDYSYKGSDGVKWILIDPEKYNAGVEGWISEEHLWRVYDALMFTEDYEDLIEDRTGTLEVPAGERVCLYEYPACPDGPFMMDESSETRLMPFDKAFMEPDGAWWVRVGNYAGAFGRCWVNLGSPDKLPEELYPNGCPIYDKRIAPELSWPEQAKRPAFPEDKVLPAVSVQLAHMYIQKQPDSPAAGNVSGTGSDRTLLYAAAGTAAAALISAAVLILMKKRHASESSGAK